MTSCLFNVQRKLHFTCLLLSLSRNVTWKWKMDGKYVGNSSGVFFCYYLLFPDRKREEFGHNIDNTQQTKLTKKKIPYLTSFLKVHNSIHYTHTGTLHFSISLCQKAKSKTVVHHNGKLDGICATTPASLSRCTLFPCASQKAKASAKDESLCYLSIALIKRSN